MLVTKCDGWLKREREHRIEDARLGAEQIENTLQTREGGVSQSQGDTECLDQKGVQRSANKSPIKTGPKEENMKGDGETKKTFTVRKKVKQKKGRTRVRK